ncbi:hypothetical protein [Nostoc sphaeroides]|nr:hypothetical protein [Nostoc sphaeroides]
MSHNWGSVSVTHKVELPIDLFSTYMNVLVSNLLSLDDLVAMTA